MRMDRNEAILLVTGMNPIRLKKVVQFEFFKGILTTKTSRFDYFKTKPLEEQKRIEQERKEMKKKKTEKITKNDQEKDDMWLSLTDVFTEEELKKLFPAESEAEQEKATVSTGQSETQKN